MADGLRGIPVFVHIFIQKPGFFFSSPAMDERRRTVRTHGLSHAAREISSLARGESSRLDGEDASGRLSVGCFGPLARGDGGFSGGNRIRQSGNKRGIGGPS